MEKYAIKLILSAIISLSALSSTAQLTGSLNQTVTTCTKTLTAVVSGGSGNYQLAWGSTGGCGVPANYSEPSLPITNCGSDGYYYVFVRDLVTNAIIFVDANVSKSISGPLNWGFPNAFSPNGDEMNDTFNLLTSSMGPGATNIHTLYFRVDNRWGSKIFEQTFTNTTTGLIASFPLWNGGISPAAQYFYYAEATNCTTTGTMNGWIQLLR